MAYAAATATRTVVVKMGSPVMSERYSNSICIVPNSDRIEQPPLAQPQFFEAPLKRRTRSP